MPDSYSTSGSSPTPSFESPTPQTSGTYLDITRKDGVVLRVLIDAADYPLVAAHRWHVKRSRQDKTFYAQAHIRRPDGSRTTVFVHQLLVPGALKVDHVNHDGLDNRRSNLRASTNPQNQHNRDKQVNARSSGFIGVDYNKRSGKFRARISQNGERLFLGSFNSELQAATAYNQAARELHGDFARLNDIVSKAVAA